MSDQISEIASTLPSTALLFRQDAYAREAGAQVLAVIERWVILDQTVFYAASGGQPSDFGFIGATSGQKAAVADLRYLDAAKTRIGHLWPEGAALPQVGDRLRLSLDFPRRYKLMRMHTALHLLSVVLPYPVTGGAVGLEDGRLDFDIPEAGIDREVISAELNRLIATDAPVTDRMIAEEELDQNPQLVKTLSVKPPRGTGTIRLVEIAGLDLQPCGGTHVRRTGEIGRMDITAIEKKGKMNRRVRIAFA
jgi:misacylated tRNA(Ala) deacylase